MKKTSSCERIFYNKNG